MRIKRVEVIGFKSFSDRAVIAIDQPITAVVGPNGCGKSNIVDAIRWCMGEQSAKHLRGKAMEDVIFAGSETRGPAPMAEVSLTFDDVGFSQERLATAMQGDEAEAAMAQIDAIAPEAEEAVDGGEGGEGGEGEAAADGVAASPDADAAAIEAALVAAAAAGIEEAAIDAVSGFPGVEAVVGVEGTAGDGGAEGPGLSPPIYDADGVPIPSAADEVRELLLDQPPAIDFTQYTEVTITRRLYRDGTSHYLINKVPCRLRDVTDFFLGTGVGTKAYAIIEQGRIGQIVSSRPQDRRLIIEEAAGITKFKSKKKAAEKKLEQTKQNLLRVSDIVTELDKRMGTLRRQAQKAERYRTYKQELRDLDLWKASHRFLELRAEAAAVQARYDEAEAERVGVRAAFETRDAAVVAERAELAVEERRLGQLQETIYELDNRVRLTESKIGFETREADDLAQRAIESAAERERLEAQLADAGVQLAARTAEQDGLAAEVAAGAAAVTASEGASAEARTLLAQAQSSLDRARGQVATARADQAKAEAQAEALVRRREESERRLARVSDEQHQVGERLREVERDGRRATDGLAELRQTRLDLGTQAESWQARRGLLAEQVQAGESRVETLRTEAHRRRSRLQSLVEIQERYEGFARGTRAVMQRSEEIAARATGTIRGLVADVVRAPETLELAVEAALGDRLGGVLVDDHAVGLAAISYLKRTQGGRSAFVPVPAEMPATIAIAPAPARRAAAPVVVEPVAAEPVAAEPVAAEPVAVEAVAVEPVAAEAVAAEAVAAEPVAVEAVAAEPVAAEPVAVEVLDADRTGWVLAGGDIEELIPELVFASESATVTEPVTEPEPVAVAESEPVSEPESEPVAVSVAEPESEPVAESESEPVAVFVAEPDLGADRVGVAGWSIPTGDAGFVVEDHTVPVDDPGGVLAATAAIGGEGVLGRLVDLVDLADGYGGVAGSLFGDCVVVDSLDRAVALHQAGAAAMLVTIDGDTVDARGVVAGGSRDAQGAGVLGQKREIRELEEIVARLDADLAEATAALVTAKTELRQVEKAIEGLRSESHRGDLAIMGQEKDAARLRSELERVRERAGQLGHERIELDERLATMTRDRDDIAARAADAADRLDAFEREQLGLIEGVTAGRDRVDAAQHALTAARVRAAQLGEKHASLDAAVRGLAATQRELGARIERIDAGLAAGRARADELRADAAILAAELVGVRDRRADVAGQFEVGRRAYDERYQALAAAEIEARDLRSRAERLATEVGHLEVRAANLASARQALFEATFERYQLDLVEVVPDYHERGAVLPANDERAAQLRELLDKMSGDINLTAIDEYGEVARRHEFLTAQQADLESAVAQLERAIDKINKTSRRLFKDAFTAINTTFKEVFPRLFRGGQAHLSLAAGKDGAELDVLEAGVEIFAQPPGKKNTTVDQLSGGEKALTAVALVFSIFLIKPSPFCILDEVDAPLDEANVDRYNEIVREMTDRSQFIVITHNKRTMESADNLYGVTMQEAGVSKLVTVNLAKLGARSAAA